LATLIARSTVWESPPFPNALAAGPLADLRSKAAGIQRDLDIHHADQLSLSVVQQDIGGADLLA
jgi:hypothetical protein